MSRRSTPSPRERWLAPCLLLLVLCAGMGLGLGLGSRLASARATAVPAPEVATPCPRSDALARPVTAAFTAEPARLEVVNVPPSAPPPPARRSARAPDAAASRRGTARAAKAPALAPDLHAALQLLRAAQQALRARNTARALSVLGEMEQRAPELLVEEREVTRALAHCAAQDVDSARRAAASVRESGAASVYEHRLSESCVGPAPTPQSLLEEMRRRALN